MPLTGSSPASTFGMPGRIRASRTAKPVHGPGWISFSTSLALPGLGASATCDRMELPLGFLAQCLSATNSDKKNARFAAWSDAGRNGIELKTARSRSSPRYPWWFSHLLETGLACRLGLPDVFPP